MNLHTCPHCQTPALYEHELRAGVNCHACGVAFTLTRFTKTERDRITRWVEVARMQAANLRGSRRLLYGVSVLPLLFLVWLGASSFGLIPDEWRLVNRRFASIQDEMSVSQAVGLVAIGQRNLDGQVQFIDFFTATAITHDGFMLTAGQVAKFGIGRRIWVFIDGRRLDAEPVGVDSIADVAVIKVDEGLRSTIRLVRQGAGPRLNDDVSSVGFPTGVDAETSLLKRSFSVSRGTISHIWTDDMGTEWIDHSAAIDTGGVGGPVVLSDRIAGLNVGSQGVIMKAVSIGPLRNKILRMIDQWRADPLRK